MFNDELEEDLSELGVDISNVYSTRILLEELLDEKSQLVNTERHEEYVSIQRIYSSFMDEYVTILDMN